MAAELWIRDGSGTPRKIKELWIRDGGGVARLIQSLWARDGGGVARKIFEYFTVTSNNLVDDVPGAATDPFVTMGTDGSVSMRFGNTGLWGAPVTAGAGANYWVRVTHNSGTAPSGALLNTWWALSSARTWYIPEAAPGGSSSSYNTYQIATDGGGATIVGSGSLDLISDRT